MAAVHDAIFHEAATGRSGASCHYQTSMSVVNEGINASVVRSWHELVYLKVNVSACHYPQDSMGHFSVLNDVNTAEVTFTCQHTRTRERTGTPTSRPTLTPTPTHTYTNKHTHAHLHPHAQSTESTHTLDTFSQPIVARQVVFDDADEQHRHHDDRHRPLRHKVDSSVVPCFHPAHQTTASLRLATVAERLLHTQSLH